MIFHPSKSHLHHPSRIGGGVTRDGICIYLEQVADPLLFDVGHELINRHVFFIYIYLNFNMYMHMCISKHIANGRRYAMRRSATHNF